ncbi:MAG: phosphomannomutase/phosphoglucomutase [Lachnospiraceae bacterium]|nr:phosphomannomutase/phosphoglucomutase [Lachnospiraceae bacterium]
MLLKLQNGTDVRGIAAEGIPGDAVNFVPADANRIAQAFVKWLSDKSGIAAADLKIAVGHDSRITAEPLKEAILKGLSAQGAKAIDCHLASTPSMFMSTVYEEFKYNGSIMITASHLPFNRNGMKFFDPEGGLEHDDITDILTIAEELSVQDADISALEEVDLISSYSAHLCEKIRVGAADPDHYDQPLKGLKIVVDAGNGAGGFFVEKVLKPLGADTTGSQFLNPDGMFPNHIPNPENKQAMAAIKKAVLDNQADLGIIFDTDVDRMSAVLPDGSEINRDAIIAMMAAILADEYPGGTIVTDSVTSDRLQDFLENHLGMKQHRFKRGYKNVINECKRLNEAGIVSPLAIETSGHGALKENYYLDDGAYMAVKLLISAAKANRSGKQIASYVEALKPGFEEVEYRLKLFGEDFGAYGKQVLKAFEERAMAKGLQVAPNSYEGVRISFRSEEIQGWLLLRMSLHEPLMPMNLEGVREGDCERMKAVARELLAGFDRVDLSLLQ